MKPACVYSPGKAARFAVEQGLDGLANNGVLGVDDVERA